MYLELEPSDLKEESKNVQTSNLKFKDFKENVQEIIRSVGRATYKDKQGYISIHSER